MDNITLKKYGGRSGTGTFRFIALDEVKVLRPGQCVWFYACQGDARRLTINGKVKTWKRDANRIEVPVKYGLYEYGRFDTNEAITKFLVEVHNG